MAEKKRNSNGMGTLSLGKDGYWRGKIQIGTNKETGKKIYKSFCGKSKRNVEDAMREFRKYDSEKSKDELYKAELGNETIKNAMTDWLIEVKRMQLKPESFRRLVGTCQNQIFPKMGEVLVRNATSTMIQKQIINPMFEEGLSLSSLKKVKSALSDFFEYWRKKQMELTGKYLPNIVSLVNLPAGHLFNTKDVKGMTDEETTNFLVELYRIDKNGRYKYEMADLINLILQTGMRIGEALALQINDYSKEEHSLAIYKNVIETPDVDCSQNEVKYGPIAIRVQNTTKTSAGKRKIPLNQSAIKAIERLIKRAKEIDESADFIAITREKTLVWPSNLTRTINLIYDKAYIDLSGAHALRHTYATAMFNQGANIKLVSTLLGHSGTQITSDLYIHCLQTLQYGIRRELRFKPYPEYLLKEGRIQ